LGSYSLNWASSDDGSLLFLFPRSYDAIYIIGHTGVRLVIVSTYLENTYFHGRTAPPKFEVGDGPWFRVPQYFEN